MANNVFDPGIVFSASGFLCQQKRKRFIDTVLTQIV